jgi:RNA polymerase sigma factor for flagellar operon FliA
MASPAPTSSPSAAGAVATAPADRDQLVQQYLPLVGYVVRDTLARVPGHVSRDDLMSAGQLALVQAADAFDPARGVNLTSYASTRIRGALVDELRSLDWASRSVRRRARQVDDARGRLAVSLGRPAEDREVAADLGMAPAELSAHKDDVARASVVSLQGLDDTAMDQLLPASTLTPADVVEQRERIAYLHDAVDTLPEKLKVVVEGYFFHDRPMAELAAELGVSESRISQLRAEAVALLKGALTRVLEPAQVEAHERPEGCAARRKEAYYASVASHRTYSARLSAPAHRTQRSA